MTLSLALSPLISHQSKLWFHEVLSEKTLFHQSSVNSQVMNHFSAYACHVSSPGNGSVRSKNESCPKIPKKMWGHIGHVLLMF